ncbi:MAG: molybdopterin oxidoreductase [Thermotogae bacterium]|uniref:DUF1667 domain-containing protein n=1 Tax=Kosmotoga arenicorallina TaxID=688066 RepID=A0A7C5DWT3_9BACT|nr:DUF1667 domain-containing protein [Kosmotoga sp.]MBO8165610.1 DUF1667 domain-containing protein [Kosmotoga sp.]MCD6159872.1 DUF1667 domain-containing protein [Kosmotoga sp.]RKX50436.1 MAG: molybdopterin oxidoreductase [Thermotogota bacterium]HHF08359.1 DUF1667 domain-containing protein [Kosmotoga arenicorallina]
MKGHITCTVCPVGCKILVVSKPNGEYEISGNRCPRGKQYAIDELFSPKRILTTSVKVLHGDVPLVSVRTDAPIEKSRIFELMEKIKSISVEAPVNVGDVLVRNIDGMGTSLVATRKVEKNGSPLENCQISG